MGPSSGASLYYDLSQMMSVRDGLGDRMGGSLGAVCLKIAFLALCGLIL